MFERIDGFEQRRDVHGDLAGDAVVGFGPARQQQRREHVVGALRAAHHVVADGVLARSDAAPAGWLRTRRACGLPERIELHLDAGIALDGLHQQVVALGGRARHPVRIVEALRR